MISKQRISHVLQSLGGILMRPIGECLAFFISMYLYGHENEMYKEGVNLKRGKDVYMRELRECGGRTENKTKCAKG